MATILAIFGGLSIITSILTVAACMLSSRISARENQEESYIIEPDLPHIPAIEATS